jgi:hypothetical protein
MVLALPDLDNLACRGVVLGKRLDGAPRRQAEIVEGKADGEWFGGNVSDVHIALPDLDDGDSINEYAGHWQPFDSVGLTHVSGHVTGVATLNDGERA